MAAGGGDSSRAEDFYKRTTLTGGWTPKSPRNNGDFLENYRKTTRELGKMARVNTAKNKNDKRPKVDDETRKIMQRIKLPTYNEAISDAMGQAYMNQYQQNPIATELAFNKASNEWDEDNFYYKLRAAQVLKNMPKKQREQYLNNFNISANDAKNELDKAIENQNTADVKAIKEAGSKLKDFLQNLSDTIGEGVKDAYLRATGKRWTTVDENGVTNTYTVSEGPADLHEFAERVGDKPFQVGNGYTYIKDGKLTNERHELPDDQKGIPTSNTPSEEERKKMGDITAKDTPGVDLESAPNNESNEEIIEYTYKPGDTFGQVIKDLGLTTSAGLWGNNGDVEYYTKQLEPQLWDSGVWDRGSRQNIPIGTTIKLKRRPESN